MKFLFFFCLKSSNCFPIKTHVSERSFSFCKFNLSRCNRGMFVIAGIYFAPARGSSTSVGDLIITSKDFIKVEHVRTWLFNSSFAKFQQFWSERFFQVLFSLVLTVYEGHIRTVCRGKVNLLLSESLRSTLFSYKFESLFSVIFSVLSSKRFPR